MLFDLAILLLAAGASVGIAWFASQRRAAPGAASLIIFALALATWSVSYLLVSVNFPPAKLFWLTFMYLGATITPTALFTFAVQYSKIDIRLTKRNIALLMVEPFLTLLLLWTDPWHGLFFAGKRAETNGVILPTGPWVWINIVYTDVLALIAIIILTQIFIHRPRPYLWLSAAIFLGLLTPIPIRIISLAGFDLISGLDLTPIAFTITGLSLTYGLFFNRLLDLVPLARDIVVERMGDGWMVLDTQNRIVDLNPAAETVIGVPREKIFGQPAESVLSDWPNLMKQYGKARELDMKGSVKVRDEWRYLNTRISPLKDQQGNYFGHLIAWRDITERRKAEEARQQARDEMFILLHSISGAASRAVNLDDFLAECNYQIVYSFQSQSSAIFLLEQKDYETDNSILTLTAYHGLTDEMIDSMSTIPKSDKMIAWILEHREPLLIPDMSDDPRLPPAMQQDGGKSMVIVPMTIEGNILGLISLMRTTGPVFSPDEIARLTVVGDEVATYIHSDRQRHLAIALAERQRLVRDLHDSVTQKLYGLLTLTEAAQAGLEAGSADVSVRVLSRIGENARQALKEMRLFLFQLQPLDLEHEGLVSVLHQRLAAVEGRADVKATLHADEKISLPLEKEVALYFIAQEALNNVLRHARAQSVTVQLKQTRTNITLGIADDGVGFDLHRIDSGGMGLKNMRDRVSNIGAKLKIVSAPGKGTRVIVSIRREASHLTRKRRKR